MMIYCLDDYSKDEKLRNKTLTMQLLIDTGLNAFAAELLAESFDKLSMELKSKLPDKLVFVIGDCEISLCDKNKGELCKGD